VFWADIKKGRTVGLMEISRNMNEWKKTMEEAKSRLVM
jgi:hypothetical protein